MRGSARPGQSPCRNSPGIRLAVSRPSGPGALHGTAVLDGAEATRAVVDARLREHAYAHFACHAVTDAHRSSPGRLVLHGPAEERPTVRDRSRLRLPEARPAYLSACDTLRTSRTSPTSPYTSSAPFSWPRFPHATGSLWHVDDVVGARIARGVDETLRTRDGALDVSRTAWAPRCGARRQGGLPRDAQPPGPPRPRGALRVRNERRLPRRGEPIASRAALFTGRRGDARG